MLYIITGVSKGLGKAIALQLLENGERVIGIGRKNDIQNLAFSFIQCDLSEQKQIEKIQFEMFNEPVTLINNAGMIGQIKRLSDQRELDTAEVLQLNVVAPMELSHKVYLKMYSPDEFTLVNISSGAANRSIPSWASYCASKAALNMLSETFLLEEKEKGVNCKVYSVSPGVIDTDMQKQIRSASINDFSSVENFIGMKENNDLFSPEEAASKLLKLLQLPYEGEVKYDLRDIS